MVLIVQSHCDKSTPPDWLNACLSSVRRWASIQGYAYQCCGDELFERLPAWYRNKLTGRGPILADLARLMWIAELLERGEHDTVVWMDADVLVFAPEQLRVQLSDSCLFGQEYWLSDSGRVRKNVHNAFCAFRKGCVVLPFLIEAVQRIVRRIDEQHIAPQIVGPKLLSHLHNTVGFSLLPEVGAVSPALSSLLCDNDRTALQGYAAQLPEPLLAANLCASLPMQFDHAMLVASLLRYAHGFAVERLTA